MMKQLAVCECTQILDIDRKLGTSTMSVRDIAMNLRNDTDNFRIFASIDEKWNSDSIFCATYRPDKVTKTYDFIKSLSTYVKYLLHGANLKRIFTFDAIEKAKSETFHPDSQTFTTRDDEELDEEIQADIDDGSIGFLELEEVIQDPFEFDVTADLVGGNIVWNFQGDDETISTTVGSTGGISFKSDHMRYYDAKSCALSVASSKASEASNESIEDINSSSGKNPKQIQRQLKKLETSTATHSIAEEATDDVAE